MSMKTAARLLDGHDYPATTSQLQDAYGEKYLNLPNGNEQLDEVFARMDEETYGDALEAQLALYSMVSSKAVGRVGYSDRDPTPMGTQGHQPISF
ncbi:DUF2795 domain-containing protein [Halobacteriaceae archaeon GCM10025711]